MDERDLSDAIRSAILVAISIFIAFFYILTTWAFYDCYRQTQRGYLRQRSLSITLVSSCSGGVTCTLFLLHNAGPFVPCALTFWTLYIGVFMVLTSIAIRALRLFVLTHIAHQKLPSALRPACCAHCSNMAMPAMFIKPITGFCVPPLFWSWLVAKPKQLDRRLMAWLLGWTVVWSLIPSIITAVSTNVRTVDIQTDCSVHWELFPLAVFVLFFTLFILPVTMYHVWGFKDMFYIRDDLVVVFLAGICLTIPFLIVKFILPEDLVDSFYEMLFIIAHLLVVQVSSVTVPIWRSRVVYRFKGCHVLYAKDVNDDLIVNPTTYDRALQHNGPHLFNPRRDFKPLAISINGLKPRPFAAEQPARPSSATMVTATSSLTTASIPQPTHSDQNPLFAVVQSEDWFVHFQKYCADNFCAELPLFLMDYQILKAKVLGYSIDHRENGASKYPNINPDVPPNYHERGDWWSDGSTLPSTSTASADDHYQSPFDIPLDSRPSVPCKIPSAPSIIQFMGTIADSRIPPLPVTIQKAYQDQVHRGNLGSNSSLETDVERFQPRSIAARPQSACVFSPSLLRSATESGFPRAKTGRQAKAGKQCQSLYLPTAWPTPSVGLGPPQPYIIGPNAGVGADGHHKENDWAGSVGRDWSDGRPDLLVPSQYHPLFHEFYQRYLAPGAHWEVNVDNSATHHAHCLFAPLEKLPRWSTAGMVIDGLCLNVFDEALNQVYRLLGQDLFPKFYLEHRAALKSLWAKERRIQPNEQAVVMVSSD